MFLSRKGRSPLISPASDRPALRMFLLMCIFVATAAAFWWHFERRLAELQPADGSYAVVDKGRVLSQEDLRLLYKWRDAFKKDVGMALLVQVSAENVVVPPFPASTLFVGLGLDAQEAVIVLPPLARKALGEGVRVETEEALAECLKQNKKPGPCLDQNLATLWKALQ